MGTFISRISITLACAFFLIDCSGRSGSSLQTDTLPAPIPPDTLPTGNPSDLTLAKKLATNLTNNVSACPGDFNAQQVLSSYEKGLASCSGGGNFSSDVTSGTQCDRYVNQGTGNLGVMACRGAYEAAALRAWIRRLLEWANRKTPTTPLPSIAVTTTSGRGSGLAAAFFSAPENTHLVGGRPCPGNSRTMGGMADCGMGKCFGNEVICATPHDDFDPSNYDDAILPLITDISLTAEGTHKVGGPGCGDSKPFGSAADCGGGTCYGNQLFCFRSKPTGSIHSGDTYVRDFKLTPENTHQVGGPGCPAGYVVKGSIADCGMATCYGNQLLCVQYATF